MRRACVCFLLATAGAGACGGDDGEWLIDPKVLVQGIDVIQEDCRSQICRHNENVDMVRWHDAIWLVHRTAMSQILGPNSSLRVSRSTDGGATFALQAIIPAPPDRDLRDPHFYIAGDRLFIKGLTRVQVNSTRDSMVDSITMIASSADGVTWTPLAPAAPETWSFWNVRDFGGVHYAGAYEDGDKSIKLFSSTDGTTWTPGATIFDGAADTPLEPEVVFMPSGRMLVFFRLDGTDDELLGHKGRLRTKVCWAMPPYESFACPQDLEGVRLDGPVAFFHGKRLMVVARKHFIEPQNRKRTALYELGGTLEGGPLTITELGELPSAGDTAYAGVADLSKDRFLVIWYSGSLAVDAPWARGIFEATDLWQATMDLSKL